MKPEPNPAPVPDEPSWEERMRRMTQMSQDIVNDQPWPVPIVIRPAEAEADPNRYETRT